MSLVLTNVNKNFGNTVIVNDLSIEMHSGLYALLGSNGAGKTTLMRMICTILRPTNGSICYNNVDVFKMGAEYRNILGYLPQEFGFYTDLTVKEYLKYISALKGLKQSVAKKRIDELLKLTQLNDYSSNKMKDLSGGMKRRVGIAQSLLNDPKILILDEPTIGLDPIERIRFRNIIGQLANDRIVLLSTHIVSDIETIAKEVFIMKSGKIITKGSIDDLCNSIPCKVWKYNIKSNESDLNISDFDKNVTLMYNNGDNIEIKILSNDRPSEDAICTKISLEDVFLYYFGDKASNKDA